MIEKFMAQIPKDDRKVFFQFISAESSSRLRNVLLALAVMQTIQMLIYVSGASSILKDRGLILIKLFIIVFSVISIIVFTIMNKENLRARKFTEPFLITVVSVILCWSVMNTFKAQSITSDISIYILVLFAVAAIVRLRPWVSFTVFGVVYLLFFIGLPRFQHNPDYMTSHLVNGLILNIVALLITQMMLRYNYLEYQDKQNYNLKNTELLYLAKHDGLTSLYNHLAIHELLEIAISNARETSEAFSIMLIDLDHFKELNDIFGHRTGDTILREVSDSIAKNIRQNDMAGRYGGDEFLIILPGSSINNTKEIAFRLLNEIRQLDFEGINLSFSCGIAIWDGDTAEQLVDKADKVLYRVKSDGRNNVYA